MAEHNICNVGVQGSIPCGGSFFPPAKIVTREVRTLDLRIMRPARFRLRYGDSLNKKSEPAQPKRSPFFWERGERKKVTRVGFEPTPFRNRALICRLRPLGHPVTQRNFINFQPFSSEKESPLCRGSPGGNMLFESQICPRSSKLPLSDQKDPAKRV